MELEITWKRATHVWWSYLWRNLIAIVVSAITGGIIGLIIGLFLGWFGVSSETVNLIVLPITLIMGLLISIIPMKMILGKDFGEFRLVLLKN